MDHRSRRLSRTTEGEKHQNAWKNIQNPSSINSNNHPRSRDGSFSSLDRRDDRDMMTNSHDTWQGPYYRIYQDTPFLCIGRSVFRNHRSGCHDPLPVGTFPAVEESQNLREGEVTEEPRNVKYCTITYLFV